MSETYAVKAVLSAVDSNFLGTMDKAAKSVEGVAKASNLSAGAIGKSMAVAGTAITAMGLKALSGYGNFQKAINQAAIIAGGSAKDIRALSDEANRLGQTLPISAQDAADAMVAMARNGASVKDLKDDFPPIAKAAAATAEDLSSTATVVQQAMNLWGGGMKNATMYSAILTETANKSNATIGDMQQVLADVGNTAVNMHMDLRTLATSIGILTNSGIPAAQAAMDLNHALLRMQAPSDKAREEMQALGISYADAQGRMKPFPQILREVAQATNGMGDAQKSAALKTLFDAAGMNAMLPLLRSVNGEAKSGNVDWNTLSAALDKAGGSFEAASTYLDNATNQMQQNLGSRIDQMKDAFIGLQNSAMASTDGMVSGIVTALDNMFTHMQTSNDAISQLARGFIGLAPVVGPATIAIGTFLTNADKIQSTMVSAAKWLVSPWGLATVAIGLMAGALIGLYQNFQPFQGAVNNVVSAFQQGFSQAMPAAIQVVKSVLDTLKNDLNIIGQAIQEQIGGSLKSIDVQSFQSMFTTAFQSIGSAIQIVVNAITQVIQGFIQAGALQAIWEAIKAVITAIGTVLQTVIGIISQYLGQSPGVSNSASAWQTVGTVVGNFAVFLANAITKLADFITNMSNAVQQMSPLQQGLIAAGGAAALLGAKFLISGGGAQALADKLLGLGGNSDKAKSSLNGTANESSNLGTQIGIAAAGIGIGAAGIAYLAQQGTAGAIALSGMTAAVVIMTGAFAKFGPSLQQSAAGITAFGTAMLELGAGIAIASAGLTLLANTGKSGITVITTLTVAVAALAAVFAALGPRLTAGSEGIVSFGVSVAAMGIGIGTAAAGIAALVAAFTGLISIMTNLNISTTQLIQNAQALGTALGVMIVSAISNVATGLQQLAPLFMQTILAIGKTIATGAPQLAQEFLNLIIGIVSVVADNLPRLFESGTELVINFIKGITQNLGEVIPAALQMLTTFISAVADNLQPVIESGLNLLVQFLYGLAQGLPQVIGAVAKVIATFLKSLADHIQEIINAGVQLLVNFLKGIADNLGKVVTAVVNVIDKFIRAVADNIKKIINSGIYLLEKFVLGIVKAIPKVTNVALKVINEFVYAVGYALGKIVSSGGKLIAAFAKGIWDGVSGSRKAGNANINAIKSAIESTNLFKSGQAIINGFLNGMKSAFNNVKDWIGGIGDWIKKHKGPIQYDRKLLIPAGNAIMQGLNFGLVSAFKDVQGNVSNMAKSIAEAANNNLSSNLNNINAKLANGTINHAVSGQLEIQQQPAYIQLQMGDNTFNAYVDDITKQQNISLDLGRF